MRYKIIKDGDPPKKDNKPKWIRLLRLAASFALLFAIYIVGMKYESKIVVYVYYGLLCASLLAFLIINRGFENKSPTADMLPDDWDDEKKSKYISEDTRRKKIARYVLYLLIPLLFIFGFDIVYMALTIKR